MVDSKPAPDSERAGWTVEYDSDFDETRRIDFRWPWRIVGVDGRVIVDFTGGSDVSDTDAHLMAAAERLRDALRLHVAKSGHTQGCTRVTVVGYPCSKRCRLTREALAACEPAETEAGS